MTSTTAEPGTVEFLIWELRERARDFTKQDNTSFAETLNRAADLIAPRVVSTVAELAALPNDSVVISDEGGIWQLTHLPHAGLGWFEPGGKYPVTSSDIALPATVLWVGGTE